MKKTELRYPIEKLLEVVDAFVASSTLSETNYARSVYMQFDRTTKMQLFVGWFDSHLFGARLNQAIPGLDFSGRWDDFINALADNYQANKSSFSVGIVTVLAEVLEPTMNDIEKVLEQTAKNPFDLWTLKQEGLDLVMVNLGDWRIIEWSLDHLDTDGRYCGKNTLKTKALKPRKVVSVTRAFKDTNRDAVLVGKLDHLARLKENPSLVGYFYDLDLVHSEFGSVSNYLDFLTDNPPLIQVKTAINKDHTFSDIAELNRFAQTCPHLLDVNTTYRVRYFLDKDNKLKPMAVAAKFPTGTMRLEYLEWTARYELSDIRY
jgi:hypothetical protein